MKILKSYYKRKSKTPSICIKKKSTCDKRSKVDTDLENLPTNSRLRTPILEYEPNINDQVRRAYNQRGPCQP